MLFLVIITLLATVSYIFTSHRNKMSLKKKETHIREKWGKPSQTNRDFNAIADYINSDSKNELNEGLEEDIDLKKLFSYIDRTNSNIGQQYLFKRLYSNPGSVTELESFQSEIESLTSNRKETEALELELSKLKHNNVYYLHRLFTQKHHVTYSAFLKLYFKIAWILMGISIGLIFITHNQFIFTGTIFLIIINLILHYRNKKYLFKFIYSLPQLLVLINVSKNILKKTSNADPLLETSLNNLSSLKRTIAFLNIENKLTSDPTDLSYAIWELLKVIFLIEPLAFISTIKSVELNKSDIERVFIHIGKIDLAISIQSLRLGLPFYCKPTFLVESMSIDIDSIYHPLIEGCVPNSINVHSDRGVLITGSNMSGKTTFIRTIAINTLLSQTLFTSCSKSYCAPVLNLQTYIRVSDNIEKNISYFQAEALIVLEIINNCNVNKPKNSLVIIDEIFKGTNTIERIAASKAVLSYLKANKNFVFVSTHDLELAELLGVEYATYSFEEVVSESRLIFDYKLKKGLLQNKNGIAILEGLGYPNSIIIDAAFVSQNLVLKHDALKL